MTYTIYTRNDCPNCDIVKKYMDTNNLDYVVSELKDADDIRNLKEKLPNDVDKTTIELPVVFHADGALVGIGKTAAIQELHERLEHIISLRKDMYYNLLRENICTVVFQKVNGDLRQMRCTLMESKLPDLFKQTASDTQKTNPNFLAAFDLDLGEWRGFRIDSVKNITIN